MSGKRVLVTGATGFIGLNLVRSLAANGDRVTCLVRPTSNIRPLKSLDCRWVYGDLSDTRSQLQSAIAQQETIYHLAAQTKALSFQSMLSVNVNGLHTLLDACRALETPPTVVCVSSLAAMGPSSPDRPHVESDPCYPVSNYGNSKAKSETLARQFSSDIPISIVRPPIVLGGGDHEGLMLFKSIDRFGVHMVPGSQDHRFSAIHVDDLVAALMAVAANGKRLDTNNLSTGIYFAAADEIPTYQRLGELIGQAVGRPHVKVVRAPHFALWSLATFNSLLGQIIRKPQYLDRDKACEATAGSWSCSNAKIKHELDFSVAASLLERLQQTAQWYRQHGWLKSRDMSPARRQERAAKVLTR